METDDGRSLRSEVGRMRTEERCKNSDVRRMRDEVKLIKEYYVYTN